jgi:hypothetical protein
MRSGSIISTIPSSMIPENKLRSMAGSDAVFGTMVIMLGFTFALCCAIGLAGIARWGNGHDPIILFDVIAAIIFYNH